jgi:hypothetical protein
MCWMVPTSEEDFLPCSYTAKYESWFIEYTAGRRCASHFANLIKQSLGVDSFGHVCASLEEVLKTSDIAVRSTHKETPEYSPCIVSSTEKFIGCENFLLHFKFYYKWSLTFINSASCRWKRSHTFQHYPNTRKPQVKVFRVVTPCSVTVGSQRFGRPCCLHLHSKVIWGENSSQGLLCSVVVGYQLSEDSEDGGSKALWNVFNLPQHYTASQHRNLDLNLRRR